MIKRQAMAADERGSVGLYLDATNGPLARASTNRVEILRALGGGETR